MMQINEEMSELLEKQMNVQNESLLLGFTQAPASPRKVCNEMKERK